MTELGCVQTKVTEVYQERCTKAVQRYLDAVKAASEPMRDDSHHSVPPFDLWRDASSYWLDFTQRSILFWDTLRQRGNNWIEHEKAGKPPLLAFDWEMIADARTFERPVNYALVRILPPDGIETDPDRRPFVIIDPRAGHGPGIGGFKQDSQVGVALKAGHPVYCVIFFPEPVSGQTLADVSRAEAEFLRIVGERHPKTRKPVLFGNCQGGWASMLVGAVEPDLVGPIVINGAPMSYWAGNDGENPMRYAGGILGGTWPALFASDLGAGKFDGAYLVENFEYLNPANTYFDKYYTLFSKIDTEPERFLEFERWWGGFFLMNRQEIKWIVENLFVGNNLAAGDAEWSEGRAFDLRSIKSPIILFASLGDNITPPQQAFNWVADLYPTTEALKANGQVIVGLMHKSVGHLGIFVSGAVAKREYTQIVDLIDYIEHLPPGLYGMQVEEQKANGRVRYDVLLTERRIEDLQVLQKYSRKDEMPFEAVERTSEALASAYETFVHPFVAPMVTPATAGFARAFNPQRAQRWAVSDLNPFLWPLKGMADLARANRAPRDNDGPMAMMERWTAAVTSASWDLYRDLRDATVENAFFRAYGPASIGMAAEEREAVAEEPIDVRNAPLVKEALAHIAEGDRTEAMVRAALLLMKAGTGRRRLSTMKRARELVGREIGLMEMPAEAAREIIREQSFIVDFEPVKALTALPKLLRTSADRRRLLDLLDRVEGQIEANEKQVTLLGEIRRLLAEEDTSGTAKAEPITVTLAENPAEVRPEAVAKQASARHARDNRRTRGSS
ncbi:poly(3-hydroxybutyrate) depolymerase [Microvirga vignae]|uniref:Poly(3-hydroxybutyrate) depolymerase n=1 Tax=Microvirga vignae TaxID=1225564 RepID=A0A0H1REA9_9HYPH|nr:poly(3-hydroxybutyrate) depolymerase [Microvirga vignae]